MRVLRWLNDQAIFLAIAVAVAVLVFRGPIAFFFYLPFIGLVSGLLAEVDLLLSIRRNGLVNIRARLWNFTHWLMLIGITVGSYLLGEVTIYWFFTQLILIGILGWQVGEGLRRKWRFSIMEKASAWIFGFLALGLGAIAGYARYIDQSIFGWGWRMELVGSIVATFIVWRFIALDIKVVKQNYRGYTKGFLFKTILSNLFVLIFWANLIWQPASGFTTASWWLRNIGLSFNIIIGNLITFVFFGYWLRYRRKQSHIL